MMKYVCCAILPVVLLTLSCGDTTGPDDPAAFFSGGFESGTMLTSQTPAGDWDGLTEVNGTMYMSPLAHQGEWGGEASVTDSCATPAWGAYLEKGFTLAGNTVYARVWFMLSSGHNLLEQEGRSFGFMWLGNSLMEEICSFRVGNYGGEPILAISYVRDGSSGPETILQPTGFQIEEDVWYCLEMSVVHDQDSGSFSAWMTAEGGSPVSVHVLGIDNVTGVELENFCIGIVDNGGYAEGSMFFDDYALAEARIGQS